MINRIKNKIFLFLHWTEKWTKTDMVYLANGGFWLTLGQIISSFSAFFLSIAFANLLSPETYGTYRYILTTTTLLSIPTLSGMQIAINRAAAKGFDGVLLKGMATSMKWGLLSAVGSLTLSAFYYINDNHTLTITFLAIAIFLPLMDPMASYNSYLKGKKQFKLLTKYNIITELSASAILILTMLVSKNIVIIIFIYFFSRTTFRFFFLHRTIKKLKPNNNMDDGSISLGKHLSLMGIISTIGEQIDKILVWHYLGGAQLAIYTISLAPVNQLRGLFSKNMAELAFPKLAEQKMENLKKTLPKKINKYIIITSSVSLLYFFTAPTIFQILFPKYLDSVTYSRIFVLTLAFIPLALYNTALNAQGEKRKLYYISISSNIIRILSFLILLPIYGIIGGIITQIFAQLYSSIMLVYFFNNSNK